MENLDEELRCRVAGNGERLLDSYYRLEHILPGDENWPGDMQGRALLAYVSHYKITGKEHPDMHALVRKIPEYTRGRGYFGPPAGDVIFEQQLSGNSWYLRGLCEYYQQFHSETALELMHRTVEGVYYPAAGKFATYPVKRTTDQKGGVGGHSTGVCDGWLLSTDVGCAFMCIDGLSHYYEITREQKAKALLDEMISVFSSMDKLALKAQTHCTLTAARGMLRLCAQEPAWLKEAEKIMTLYVRYGMTGTYQNYNWWGRGDTWTEPCAVVDSLMLAGELYRLTGQETYRRLCARIYCNGFATMQRGNGGAGPDSTVSATTKVLEERMFEAPFCCTMRLAEGLWYASCNRELLIPERTGRVTLDEMGRYRDGDVLYTELTEEMKPYADLQEVRTCDGYTLVPLVRQYRVPEQIKLKQRVIFR